MSQPESQDVAAAEVFDRHASDYRESVERSVAFAGKDVDFYAERKAVHLLDLVRRHLGPPAGLRALDVGCGVGVTDALLVDEFAALEGIDVAGEAVKVAIERNPRASYRSYDGDRFPLGDASVDVAFAICVLHHVPPAERARFASELHRVLRPGGLAMVFEHNPFNPLTRVAVSRCELDEDAVLLRSRESRDLLASAGFGVVERRYVLFLPIGGAVSQGGDRLLSKVPLGAQYATAAIRP